MQETCLGCWYMTINVCAILCEISFLSYRSHFSFLMQLCCSFSAYKTHEGTDKEWGMKNVDMIAYHIVSLNNKVVKFHYAYHKFSFFVFILCLLMFQMYVLNDNKKINSICKNLPLRNENVCNINLISNIIIIITILKRIRWWMWNCKGMWRSL